MTGYVLRRILHAIPILFGVALVTFIVFHVAGGDPVLQLAGKHATQTEVDALRHEYGLDRPLPAQFLHFLKQLATFDFERSFQTRQTIGRMLADGAAASLWLTVPAFIAAEILSVLLALLAAAARGKAFDRLIVITSVFGMSLSFLAYILFGQYFLAFHLGWFPISGYGGGFPENLRYLFLPWLILIAVSVGTNVRFFRTVFLEEMDKDYVRTARAKGVGPARVLLVHVLRNAMLPVITRIVIEIPFLLMGSLLLENFFGIPGLGSMAVDAINTSDWPVLKAVTFLGAALYIAFNLISDLLYAAADPRVVLE